MSLISLLVLCHIAYAQEDDDEPLSVDHWEQDDDDDDQTGKFNFYIFTFCRDKMHFNYQKLYEFTK